VPGQVGDDVPTGRHEPGRGSFQTARGRILQDSAYITVWTEARKQALTPAQGRSPLGRRPYDLRHAAVSLWLNSGGQPPRSAAPGTASRSC
jgi:integrase